MKSRLVRARVKDGVELPIESSPGRHMFLLPEFAHVFPEHCVRFGKIFVRKVRNRQLKHLGLEQRANGKQFSNVIGRERGNDGAAVRDNCDQALGVELAKSLANRNSADLILGRDRVLSKLSAFRNFAAYDLFT